jgi:predicted nucleic acid-binding protein
VKKIADTGLLLAALDKSDPFHEWGLEAFSTNAPFITCDAVLVELSYHLNDAVTGMKLVERGDLILDFNLAAETKSVLDLLHKYRDRKMELADACLVRMTELESQSKIWTVDRSDFSVYRRHGRQPVPCEFPPRK